MLIDQNGYLWDVKPDDAPKIIMTTEQAETACRVLIRTAMTLIPPAWRYRRALIQHVLEQAAEYADSYPEDLR